jgi:hypothetical protein
MLRKLKPQKMMREREENRKLGLLKVTVPSLTNTNTLSLSLTHTQTHTLTNTHKNTNVFFVIRDRTKFYCFIFHISCKAVWSYVQNLFFTSLYFTLLYYTTTFNIV